MSYHKPEREAVMKPIINDDYFYQDYPESSGSITYPHEMFQYAIPIVDKSVYQTDDDDFRFFGNRIREAIRLFRTPATAPEGGSDE
jgi:hypothetical protein